MMKSSASRVLFTYTVIMSAVAMASSGSPSADGLIELRYWRWMSPKPDRVEISLGCLLLGDVGCDAECYIVTFMYGFLGSGVCDKNYICNCNFVADTSLENMWPRKFQGAPTLQEIQDDSELSKNVQQIFLNPFQTGRQIKKRLERDLPGRDFDKLEIRDFYPAGKIFPEDGRIEQQELEQTVRERMNQITGLILQGQSDCDYESALNKYLQNYPKKDDNHIRQLVFRIRRFGNKPLKSIVGKYPKEEYQLGKNDDIYVIMDEALRQLILEIDEMFPKESAISKWFSKALSMLCPWCCGSKSVPVAEQKPSKIEKDERYKLSEYVYKAIKSIPPTDKVNKYVRDKQYKYKMRYTRSGDAISLSWVKTWLRVSIQKNIRSNVIQIWNFERVSIHITRTSEGSREYWNFGDYSYTYPGGNGAFDGEWSDGTVRKQLLNEYKGYIDTWCRYNEVLVPEESCAIYKQ